MSVPCSRFVRQLVRNQKKVQDNEASLTGARRIFSSLLLTPSTFNGPDIDIFLHRKGFLAHLPHGTGRHCRCPREEASL